MGKQEVELLFDMIEGISLNRILIAVDGSMVVDVAGVAAQIHSVDIKDADTAAFWNDLTTTKTCVIGGAYLTGGAPKILEAEALHIGDVKAVPDGSNDQTLNCSFKLSKPIAAGQKLTFVVEKTDKDEHGNERTVTSNQWVYVVEYPSTTPQVDKLDVKDGKLTVTGQLFFDLPQNPLKVQLHPVTAGGSDRDVTPTDLSNNTFTVTLPSDLNAGCWTVQVNGIRPAKGFAVPPTPAPKSAKRENSTVVVEGDGFIDTSACSGPALKFQFVEDKPDATPVDARIVKLDPGEAKLNEPDAAKTSNWTVHVIVGTVDKSVKLEGTTPAPARPAAKKARR